MSELTELVARIEASRAALAAGCAASAARWNEPVLEGEGDEPTWRPRDAAEHALSNERMYARYLDAVFASDAPVEFMAFMPSIDWDWSVRSYADVAFEDAASAQAALLAGDESLSTRLRSLDESDAARPVGLHEGNLAALEAAGLPAAQTVASVLGVVALHNEQHAVQLAAAG